MREGGKNERKEGAAKKGWAVGMKRIQAGAPTESFLSSLPVGQEEEMASPLFCLRRRRRRAGGGSDGREEEEAAGDLLRAKEVGADAFMPPPLPPYPNMPHT